MKTDNTKKTRDITQPSTTMGSAMGLNPIWYGPASWLGMKLGDMVGLTFHDEFGLFLCVMGMLMVISIPMGYVGSRIQGPPARPTLASFMAASWVLPLPIMLVFAGSGGFAWVFAFGVLPYCVLAILGLFAMLPAHEDDEEQETGGQDHRSGNPREG